MDETKAAAEWVSVEDLRAWSQNPRLNDHAAVAVAESIERFGFGAPMVARLADGEVIAGHTRLKAVAILRAKHGEGWVIPGAPGPGLVPVRYLDLTEQQAHELAVADNRLGENAEWNPLLLQALSEDGIDLEAVGFTEAEIDDLLREPGEAKAFSQGTKPAASTRRAVVALHVYVEDVEAIETALDKRAKAGETRGDTLARICRGES